jgi:hypothetical protein
MIKQYKYLYRDSSHPVTTGPNLHQHQISMHQMNLNRRGCINSCREHVQPNVAEGREKSDHSPPGELFHYIFMLN